ncbi:MAG: thiamine pyrophosphate-binding protein [Candidatus Hydrogenedentes bacterium]|nr:thiamine pyrophosphate-binding protein [Candidatus Hydrogenedentota bacterium]
MDKMKGGDVIARMLKVEGVEKVFGIIDGTYFGFYSSLRKYGIDLITPRHETSAAHMAGAYARITGKLGVCMASNGPGVANILPGVAVENGEGNRVLLITSTRRTGIGYPDRGGTYQYFNQVGVIKPMAKWSGAAPSFARVPEMLRRAFRKSFQGRPGVVHVDIPENIMNGDDVAPAFLEPSQYRLTDPISPSAAQVDKAADLLLNASLPIIHAGSGVIHALAFDELRELAELLHAPVLTSWAARGVFPEDHELAVPMIHVELNHRVRNDADVVLTLGSRLGETDWWGKAPYWRQPAQQQMIQVDNDEDVLGMNKPTALAVLADARVFLRAVIDTIKSKRGAMSLNGRKSQVSKYAEMRKAHRAQLDERLSGGMNAGHVTRACESIFDKNAICAIDGGNTAIWAHFYRTVKSPNTILQTAKFGMLGAGVAQTLGAKVAAPDKQVYCIIGDGAMGFQPQEIETAVRNKLAVTYLVCCDKQWGMVKMNQQFTLQKYRKIVEGLGQKFSTFGALNESLPPLDSINTDLGEIKWDKLAESMGAHGERVNAPDQLKPAIERSVATGGCSVIHCDVDPVTHMWAPSLKAFKDMHQEPTGK